MLTDPFDEKPTIRIFHNMARSGGTLVCKCIGAMENVRLFSEIHPKANFAEYLNIVDQAHRWYGLTSKEDIASKLPFSEGLQLVYEQCQNENSQMVIRDWASIDFIGKVLIDHPTYRFALDQWLGSHFKTKVFALVRHPLDQWLSTRRLNIYADKLSEEEFFLGYRCYAEAVQDHFIRYEDFTANPESAMTKICRGLDLQYDAGFMQRWHLNEAITGDNKRSSRGTTGDEAAAIRSLPRREIDRTLLAQIRRNDDYHQALAILGYEDVVG